MLILGVLYLMVLSARCEEKETTMSIITAAPTEELQTEETSVLRKPENSTLPSNHSETLRAMPTESTKTQHDSRANSEKRFPMIQSSQTQTQAQQVVKLSPVLNITAVTDVGKLKDFRPSPQLETIYEYNHFPVEPALPEPKHFLGSSIKYPVHSTLSHVQDHQEKDVWTSKVRFPSTHPLTVNDHPYPYLKESMDKGVVYNSYHKDYSGGKRPIMQKHSGYDESWDKTLKRKPPSKTFEEERYNTDLTASPWKKIIKILTAFIPIGLLISALTPSIITIGPMNGTARSGDKPKHNLLSQLALDGCDERIFCELMLSAQESGNNDKNIDTMLTNYMESHRNSTRLQVIYKAIQSGNCSTLQCSSIKD